MAVPPWGARDSFIYVTDAYSIWTLLGAYAHIFINVHLYAYTQTIWRGTTWRTLAEVRVEKKYNQQKKIKPKNRKSTWPSTIVSVWNNSEFRIWGFCFMASLYQTCKWGPRWFERGSLQERLAIQVHEEKRRKRKRGAGGFVLKESLTDCFNNPQFSTPPPIACKEYGGKRVLLKPIIFSSKYIYMYIFFCPPIIFSSKCFLFPSAPFLYVL